MKKTNHRNKYTKNKKKENENQKTKTHTHTQIENKKKRIMERDLHRDSEEIIVVGLC